MSTQLNRNVLQRLNIQKESKNLRNINRKNEISLGSSIVSKINPCERKSMSSMLLQNPYKTNGVYRKSEKELMEIKIKIQKSNGRRTPSTTTYSVTPSESSHARRISKNFRGLSRDSLILSDVILPNVTNANANANANASPPFKELNTSQKSLIIASIVDQIEKTDYQQRRKKSCAIYKRLSQPLIEMGIKRTKSNAGIDRLSLDAIDEEKSLQKRKPPKSKGSLLKNVRQSIYGFTSSLLKNDRKLSLDNFGDTMQCASASNEDMLLHANILQQIEAQMYDDNIPVMKTAVALNNFLIRDFKIGAEAEGLKSSW